MSYKALFVGLGLAVVAPSAAVAAPGPLKVVESTISVNCRQGGVGLAYPVSATVRVRVPSSAEPGDDVTASAAAEFSFDEAFAAQLSNRYNSTVGLQTISVPFGITGTRSGGTRELLSPSGYTPARDAPPAPFTVSVPEGNPASVGVVASAATSVDITFSRIDLLVSGSGFSPVDGLQFVVRSLYECTSATSVLASIPVGQIQPEEPEEPEEPTTVARAYDVVGNATLKTLARGAVGLTGSLATTRTTATGAITGDLRLANTTANLVAFGFLPVSARLGFASTAPTTGSLADGVLTTNSKIRIKVPSVRVFGVELAGGNSCQTRQVSSIGLTSSAFDPAVGGTLTGSFAISDLAGCGALTGIVSPLTAGASNALALRLTPQV